MINTYALLNDYCSMAIVQYLADKFSTPDHWYPEDIAIRAKINEYLCWHHTNTREGAGYLFFEVVSTVVLSSFSFWKFP